MILINRDSLGTKGTLLYLPLFCVCNEFSRDFTLKSEFIQHLNIADIF